MKRDQITAGLQEILKRQKQVKVDISTITEATRLNRVGFDSLSILDFIYEVEDRFNIQAEIADLAGMETVKDLIDYLERRIPG